jgi:hypothetical protein
MPARSRSSPEAVPSEPSLPRPRYQEPPGSTPSQDEDRRAHGTNVTAAEDLRTASRASLPARSRDALVVASVDSDKRKALP